MVECAPRPPVSSLSLATPASPRSAMMSVAPTPTAGFCRSACRLKMTIRSAPSCLAASTPSRPTAPSPTTATVLPGPASAATAANQPVPSTSEAASSDGTRSGPGMPEVATSVPSASGTRARSAWVPMVPISTLCTQRDWCPARQIAQVLSEVKKEPTTKSPTLIVSTAPPTCSTTPTYSWPIGVGRVIGSMPRYGQRSEPHTHAAATLMTASVGSTIVGSSRSSTRTSRGPYRMAAFIGRSPCPRGGRSALDRRGLPVLLVGDLGAPGHGVPLLARLLEREVRHEAGRRGAVPVVLARLEEDAVARADDLDRAAAPLAQADALGDVDGLAVRVRVPGRPRAGREVDARRAQERRAGRHGDPIDEDGAGEPLARPATGLKAVPGDLRRRPPCVSQGVCDPVARRSKTKRLGCDKPRL